ncbi:MAG TPA: hypothetical protein VJP06_01325, partial [Thermoplasmata archaeon]|nr:hypothetical protein [Thermoplasmata archaeon]
AYESGEPRPDRVEVSEAAFVPLDDLVTSTDAAPFTRAIIPKLAHAVGLGLDPYAPSRDGHEPLAYLLYL